MSSTLQASMDWMDGIFCMMSLDDAILVMTVLLENVEKENLERGKKSKEENIEKKNAEEENIEKKNAEEENVEIKITEEENVEIKKQKRKMPK